MLYHVDRVDIPEKAKILTLSEPEESYDDENIEMTPLNETEDSTDSRKVFISASAAKQKEECDVELKSPVSVEASVVNKNLFTPTQLQPTQETSVLTHKQRMVVPPIKSCYYEFETEPILYQENVSYHIRPRTEPWHEFSSSASTSVPVAA